MNAKLEAKERKAWERWRDQGRVKYVLSVVFFQAWPAGLFFGTVTFFPFTIGAPFVNVDNPVRFMAFWTVMGIVVGLFNWRNRSRKYGSWVSDSSETVPR